MIQILSKYGQMLLFAMGQTLLLALWGLFFACILGMIFGLLSVVRNKVCNVIASIFVDVIRGVPMIVLAYFIFFGLPYAFKNFLGSKMTLTALQAGTAALALNCGAYMAEIIRAGIQSVDPGQMEAMIPSIINQFIITLKDTSILSVIGFPELVNTAKNVIAISFKSFEVWGIVAVMYLIVITILSKIAKRLERRLNRGRK